MFVPAYELLRRNRSTQGFGVAVSARRADIVYSVEQMYYLEHLGTRSRGPCQCEIGHVSMMLYVRAM